MNPQMPDALRKLIRAELLSLTPYVSSRDLHGLQDGLIFLDANESPTSPLPESLSPQLCNRYPEPQPANLCALLASLYDIPRDTLLITRGSDEGIDLLVRTFCAAGQDSILITPPTFDVYRLAARIQGADVLTAPLDRSRGFAVDHDAILAAWRPGTKIIFLCSPNNPTGSEIPADTIASLAHKFLDRSIIVVDEAYIEFSDAPSTITLQNQHPNIVVLRTLSKARGLAGLRIGAVVAHPELIRCLRTLQQVYPIPHPASTLAQQALSVTGRQASAQAVASIRAERQRMAEALTVVESVRHVYPSCANFLLVAFHDAKDRLASLKALGIMVRPQAPPLDDCLRITIGTPFENTLLLHALGHPDVPVAPRPHSTKAVHLSRKTNETNIEILIDPCTYSPPVIDTGIGFFDHMLCQIAVHSALSITLTCRGDLDVDTHHTIEDCAIVIGQALKQTLGDKSNIKRYGFVLPMDEAEARLALDLGGRPYLVFEATFREPLIGSYPSSMTEHFFRSLATSLGANIHLRASGTNGHHVTEACYKALGRALRVAMGHDSQQTTPPSSKGSIP